MTVSYEELTEAAARGNCDAFAALLARHCDGMFRLAFRLTGRRDWAADGWGDREIGRCAEIAEEAEAIGWPRAAMAGLPEELRARATGSPGDGGGDASARRGARWRSSTASKDRLGPRVPVSGAAGPRAVRTERVQC